jgi:hypothetical protein
MAARTHITPAMQAAVGTELHRRTSFPVTDSDIRRWALAVYYPETPPRLFWDADHAAGTVHGGIVTPEDFNPFAWMTPAAPGAEPDLSRKAFVSLEHQLGIEGPDLPSMVNGGREVHYGVRIRPGDVIRSVSRLAEYSEREGRLGLMLFSVTEDTWTNQRDEHVSAARMTLIRY